MSMSERNQALMNGLDIVEDKSEPNCWDWRACKVDTKEIEELISQTKV